jgi:UDPglucose 6-dehydrogenase
MTLTVGYAGMTHLGLNSAAAAASRGFDVVAYDGDEALIDALRQRRLPVLEPGLDGLVADHAARLCFTADAGALARCDLVTIAADVPTGSDGRSDLDPIRALVARVAPTLGLEAVLVVLAQVPPGFTRAIAAVPPQRLYYQVETLIFGRAVERALHPERFIVGCADPSRPLAPAYRRLLEAFSCPILAMRYESAELAKIAINVCLAASIGAANTLAETSEAVGADWAEIVPALKLDRRIGPHAYLAPGMGISGGNIERDLRAVLDIADAKGTDAGVVKAWLANSRHRKEWCWRVLRDRVLARWPEAAIGVLGLAYKEDTDSTRNSPALALLAHLEGSTVRVHDPAVAASVAPFAERCAAPIDCARGAAALVIATPWPQYRALAIADLASVMAGNVLIDPYRLLDGPAAARAGFEYHALGMSMLAP